MRWLYFICLALLSGGLGFRLFVLRGDATPEAERRFYRLTGAGVVGALEVGIVAFLLRAQDALQLPFTAFSTATSPRSRTTRASARRSSRWSSGSRSSPPSSSSPG